MRPADISLSVTARLSTLADATSRDAFPEWLHIGLPHRRPRPQPLGLVQLGIEGLKSQVRALPKYMSSHRASSV